MSRTIFEKRLMYSATKDERYLNEMICTIPEVKYVQAQLEMNRENFLFGAGYYGERFIALTNPQRWAGILDNDEKKWGKKIGGVPILPPSTLENHPDAVLFNGIRATGKPWWPEIEAQWKRMGITKERIVRADQEIMDVLSERQYFDLAAVGHSEHEVFVDGGCLNGDSALGFIKWAEGKFDHIYSFEPDPASIDICRKTLAKISEEKTTLFPYGLWKERNELHFSKIGIWSSLTEGDISVPVSSIDHELTGKHVTMIKMDIEGAELAALEGAQNCIREQHPKLIICVYHKPEDIIEIPAYILSLCPDYKLYLRHYSLGHTETVLYAV